MIPARVNDAKNTNHLHLNDWWMQQKYDGVRLLVEVTEQGWSAYNRRGEQSSLSGDPRLDRAFSSLRVDGTVVFDGEFVGDWFVVFDFLAPGIVEPEHPFETRFSVLESYLDAPGVVVAKTAKTTDEKEAMFQGLLERGAEGVIFRDRLAPYYQGYHPRAGVLRWKFTKTIDCVVLERTPDGKDSVTLGLLDLRDEAIIWHNVGKASTVGKSVEPGEVVEVEFLYATESNRLYQPRIKRVRTDKLSRECTLGQLEGTYTDRNLIL